jgi:hypothetical protein
VEMTAPYSWLARIIRADCSIAVNMSLRTVDQRRHDFLLGQSQFLGWRREGAESVRVLPPALLRHNRKHILAMTGQAHSVRNAEIPGGGGIVKGQPSGRLARHETLACGQRIVLAVTQLI